MIEFRDDGGVHFAEFVELPRGVAKVLKAFYETVPPTSKGVIKINALEEFVRQQVKLTHLFPGESLFIHPTGNSIAIQVNWKPPHQWKNWDGYDRLLLEAHEKVAQEINEILRLFHQLPLFAPVLGLLGLAIKEVSHEETPAGSNSGNGGG